MKKRIVGLILAVVMALSLVPLTVFAGADSGAYPVWVGGVQVTESNKANVLGNSSVAFDSSKGILTLKNAIFSKTGSASGFNYGIQCVYAVKSELDKLTVKLVGNSQIGKEVNSASSLEDYSIDIGFFCTGDIVFTGDADSSLTVYDYGAGIQAKNVTFGEDFKGKLTVRDCGGPEPQPPCAINAFGVRDEESWNYISDGTVGISGGTFDIESFQSNGIAADGNIIIKNAKLTCVAGLDAVHSEYGNVTFKDSTANIHAKWNGIYCKSLSVAGANIYSAADTDSDAFGCGVYINGDESAISISGSTVKLTGGEAAIKLEKSSETNPFNGALPNVSFKGNIAYDTFSSMETVNYKSQKNLDMVNEYFETAYVADVLAKSVSVIHTHKLVKVDGQAATESAAGFKEYYECKGNTDACHKYFEDANARIEITDLAKWKAKGGNGYLPKLEKEMTSPKTGDTSDMIFMLALLVVSLIGLVSCGIIGRKIKNV